MELSRPKVLNTVKFNDLINLTIILNYLTLSHTTSPVDK